jgi:uncharacterized membrane protein YfcA
MPDSLWVFPLLFVTGLAAGLVDSVAGGGGLLTLPVLLSLGFPPKVALGTNKFQSSFGSYTAASYYAHHNVVSLKEARTGVAFTLIGAALGTWGVQQIDSGILRQIIPALLLCIVVYTFLTPKFGDRDSPPRFSATMFYALFGTTLGFYDGFFGPGVGSFWAMALVLGLGMNLTQATGYTKVMNFTSNIVSCIIFLIAGYVWFAAGLVMAAGQIIGSRVGALLVIRRGARFIRPIFVSIVILTTLKLLYDQLR